MKYTFYTIWQNIHCWSKF